MVIKLFHGSENEIKELGLSQKELAEEAQIPIRTIQQYEQGKNINNAKAEYVYALSKVLCCRIEDLFEL